MKKRKFKKKKIVVSLITITILILAGYFTISWVINLFSDPKETAFIASINPTVKLYDLDYKEVGTIIRGKEVKKHEKNITNKETKEEYYKIDYDGKTYLIKEPMAIKVEEVVKETEKFVRTPVTVYKASDDVAILSTIKKSEKISIIGYDKLNSDGTVTMYKIKYNDVEGYVYSKYLVDTLELAKANYDENGMYVKHATKLSDPYKVGMAGNLDYYPYAKASFEDNKMPNVVKSLYLNRDAIKRPNDYINAAKKIGANAFVVDIKDNGAAYKSPIMKEYSKSTYDKANDTMENYKANVKKLKDAGFYVIGRIVIFNDTQYGKDNIGDVIVYKNGGGLFNGQHWLTPYSRRVWEYNTRLAIEAVEEIGFNEIQFDYVRFPDRTGSVESQLDFRNKYNESKAQAVQNFLFYATDEIHKKGAYVSADVFGESAHNYVTGYGQYWPAMSNIVDVISGMPYPDHFSAHTYGIEEVCWTVPEKLLTIWSGYVKERQKEIPTPAIVRTWIQAYNTIHEPYIEYGDNEIIAQITGLYANGLTGGWMTWSASSNLDKYNSFTTSFKKDYGV